MRLLRNLLNKKESGLKTLKLRIRKQKKANNWHDSFDKRLQKPLLKQGKKSYENKENTGPNGKKKSSSSGSETLAYLKEKIEKEAKFKEQELDLRKKIELQERGLQIAQDKKIKFYLI